MPSDQLRQIIPSNHVRWDGNRHSQCLFKWDANALDEAGNAFGLRDMSASKVAFGVG